MINLSAWDSALTIKKLSPQLSPSHLIIEFDRTKKIKIFAHQLGKITFGPVRNINSERQEVINREIENLSISGFRYKNIGHVYSPSEISVPLTIEDENHPVYKVYAHGHAISQGKESCSRSGLICAPGSGSNTICAPGRCVIGYVTRVKNTKWQYESVKKYGSSQLSVKYFFSPAETINLKTILRGEFEGLEIVSPASIFTTLYLPPKFYFSEDFFETALVLIDRRLEGIINSPFSNIIGIDNRKDTFIRKFIISVYPNTSEGYLNNQLSVPILEQIKTSLEEAFEELPEVWKTQINIIIEAEWAGRLINNPTGFEFISACYDKIALLFNSIIQVTPSSLKLGAISYSKSTMARPIYSRLPGMAEAYRSDPAFSEKETPSQWMLSGADEFLASKKENIASFYQTYLSPETCSSPTLDWLAQHLGLTGDLWNVQWDRPIKEAMIRNAFGWWDREGTNESNNSLTPKGQALNKFPFTNSEWVDEDNEANFLRLKLDEIETIDINPNGTYNSYNPFKAYSSGSHSELVVVNAPRINKFLWNGLIEAKGSLLVIAFLVSIFGLKSHSPAELQIINAERKILKPRSGLRNAEISAPPLVPHKYDVIQVGTEEDAEIGNYTNQLVAGVSRVSSTEESRNIFFRMPYYYNRDGKSWDRATYIAKNWLPSHLNVRIQYAYLSADLWAVGDGFFEPELTEVS